jgi:translation initiation factor eIF-2B subunit delta
LCETIDNYIEERITAADQVIAQSAGLKIKNGDALLTYARCASCQVVPDFLLTPMTRSSVVERMLLRAHEEGKIFSVYVVDSRPMLEGSFWR